MPRARLGELLQDVALVRRRVDDVESAGLRAEHGEPIVMLRRDHDVLHAGVFGELHPLIRVVFDGIELRRELFVFLYRHLGAEHNPLAEAEAAASFPFARGDGVQTPVNEEAVFGVAEPLEPLFAGGVALAEHLGSRSGRERLAGRRNREADECGRREQSRMHVHLGDVKSGKLP